MRTLTTIQLNTVQYGTVQYNTVEYSRRGLVPAPSPPSSRCQTAAQRTADTKVTARCTYTVQVTVYSVYSALSCCGGGGALGWETKALCGERICRGRRRSGWRRSDGTSRSRKRRRSNSENVIKRAGGRGLNRSK